MESTQLDFLELELSHFKSFLKPQRLVFADYGCGLNFLRGRNETEPRLGSNGAGKSTLFDALCWVLYGKTIGGLRGPDIRSWSGKKSPCVTLRLQRGETQYVIERTANPNLLTLDGKEASQEDIDHLIGLNLDTFNQTVLMGQGKPLFYDLANRDKMQMLSDVLELDRWEKRSVFAAERVRKAEGEQARIQGEETGLRANLDQMLTQIAQTKERMDEWAAGRDQRLTQLAKDIAEQTAALTKQEDKLKSAQVTEDGALTELRSCEDQIGKLNTNRVRMTQDEAREIANIQNARKAREGIEAELAELKTARKCPTCKQPVTKDNLADHKRELESRLAKMQKPDTVSISLDAIKGALAGVNKSIKSLEDARLDFRKKADDATARVRLLTPAVADLRATLKAQQEARAALDKDQNPHRAGWQDLVRRKDQVAADLATIKADLETLSARIERSRFWVKGFKDVRLFVIDEMLEELELTTNAIIEEVGLVGWRVVYDVEKDTKSGTVQRGITVNILSPDNRDPVRWECWSGGEGQRLRVAGALALSEVLLNRAGVDCNLEILDEPTRHLSSEGVEDMCEFLANRARQIKKQIWYVDHQAVESAKFASVLTVVKTKDGSELKEDA